MMRSHSSGNLEKERLYQERKNLEQSALNWQVQADYVFGLLMDPDQKSRTVLSNIAQITASLERLERGQVRSKYSVVNIKNRLKEVAGFGAEKKEANILGWVATILLVLGFSDKTKK